MKDCMESKKRSCGNMIPLMVFYYFGKCKKYRIHSIKIDGISKSFSRNLSQKRFSGQFIFHSAHRIPPIILL